MINQSRNNRDSTRPSLLIAAHCLTIQRKKENLDIKELSAILDDFVRELNSKSLYSKIYFNSLNEIIYSLNTNLPLSLISLYSHDFFILIRNTIQNLLQQLHTKYYLNHQKIYILRNCILLFEYLVKKLNDLSNILYWITDIKFINSFVNCLYNISKLDKNILFIRQITRLLNIFIYIQEHLSLDLHKNLFIQLFQPIINCLTSLTYIELFKNLKIKSTSLTAIEKFFLIKCPYFLTSYNGSNIEKTNEQILEIILPHYISIFDKHIKTIKQWNRPIIRSMYYLLTTLIFFEDYFISYQSFRSLINHLLHLINEPKFFNKIQQIPRNSESLLIDAALRILSILIYQSDALEYIKQRKSTIIFRQLISTSCETIVLNAYIILAYTMDENNIQEEHNDLSRLFNTTLNLLHKAVESHNSKNIDRNIIQFCEILRGLVQYEHIKNEILKQNIIKFFIEYSEKLNGLSKQFLLECLWTLSFNKQIAQQIYENSQFIHSLQNISKSNINNNQQNIKNFGSRRNNTLISLNEIANDGIYKIVDGLLWNLVKEAQFREKKIKINDQKYKYDIMISYCYNDKNIVDKIQQFLINEGFDIWFDHDNPYKKSMETTAEAIDNSELVIMCISDSYKRDNYCQAEAEYAFNSKRLILPLIVHKGYKIEGWLTSIINKNMSIDFDISDFKTAFSLLIKEINQHYKTKLSNIKSRATTPIDAKQIILPSTSVAIDRHQQQISERVISRPTTPGMTPVVSTVSLVNGNDQTYLPEEYTKRDTSDSTYRSISINFWTKKDILDFLYDSKLNIMMPLCELMTGRALIRFFGMCQAKPSRIYKQLNEELYHRFKGLTLPMGVYSQFLIEIDNLLDTVSDTHKKLTPLPSNNVERLIYMPDIAQSQRSSIQSSSTPSIRSTISPTQSNTFTPINTISELSAPSSTRVIKRSVFRPASTAARPYNFIIESAEEGTAILQQIERYAPQLLLLDEKARQHREMNGSH